MYKRELCGAGDRRWIFGWLKGLKDAMQPDAALQNYPKLGPHSSNQRLQPSTGFYALHMIEQSAVLHS